MKIKILYYSFRYKSSLNGKFQSLKYLWIA